MSRLLYRLLMPAFLVLLWLLLNDAFSWGQLALGAVLALALLWAGSGLRPLRARPKRPLTMARLFCAVAADMLQSNLAVGRLVWSRPGRGPTPGFVKIPLDLRDPHGLAILACIVTYTPGTVWVGLSEGDEILTLHVLDLKEDSDWIMTIKQRYETPLMEIFE